MFVQHGERLAEDLIERHSGSSAWGSSLHRAHSLPRSIPEHERGLHAREESEACHSFTPSATLATPCRTESVYRKCRDDRDLSSDSIASAKIGRKVTR